ncbi:MAG TPA: phosphodiesterase [Candidatus Angelobacter sp.]|nr:phosphodiesterase [Candidatus Angelobacter sp.]
MLLAQISDLHVVARGKRLYGRIDTPAFLTRAVAHLNALAPRPDFVWITGDLVDQGSPAEYAHLREILGGLEIPWALMPGNHDDRASLRRAFADQPYLPRDGEFLQYALDDLPLRLLALDTLIPGESGGRLCQARLEWLAARLAEHPDRPTVIAMHHPPFLTGLAEMDTINCDNSAALGAIVAEHPQIERIVCGHVHRPMVIRWNGTVVTTAPATAHQVALNLLDGTPTAWIMEPPACHLHYWRADSGLVTHHSYIGDYGAATPY